MEFSVLAIYGKVPSESTLVEQRGKKQELTEWETKLQSKANSGLGSLKRSVRERMALQSFPTLDSGGWVFISWSFFIEYGLSWKTNLRWSKSLQTRQLLKELKAKGCLRTALPVAGTAILPWRGSEWQVTMYKTFTKETPQPSGPAAQMEGGSLRYCISEK